MERVLTNYIRALRSAGAGVSTTEALDAARTVELVGYGDRALLKAALAPVLTKSVEETEIHNRLFDLFFARSEASTMASAPAQSESGDGEGSAPAESPSLTDLAQSGDAGQIAMAMEKAGAAVGVDQIRFASQVGYFTRRMLEELGVDQLEARLLEKLQAKTPEAEAATVAAHLGGTAGRGGQGGQGVVVSGTDDAEGRGGRAVLVRRRHAALMVQR